MRQIISRTDAPSSTSKVRNSTLLQGFPLVGAQAYALARTWPDRRKGTRPGTVLTHLLLIDLPDLGREDIVLPLLELLKDDPNYTDFERFKLPIHLETRRRARARVTTEIFRAMKSSDILSQVYELNEEQPAVLLGVPLLPVPSNVPVSSGAELFLAALWEQQWPRLRRSFSFVITDWNAGIPLSHRYPSDLMLYSRELRGNAEPSHVPQWVKELEDDLISPGPLRRFLRRAGADIKKARQAMRPLIDIYMHFHIGFWSQSSYLESAELIFEHFSSTDDAKWLKQQIYDVSMWSKQAEFRAIEFIPVLLDINRRYDTPIRSVDWRHVIIKAMQEDAITLSSVVAAAFDDDDVPLAEDFRNEYLDNLSIFDLPLVTKAQPFLLQAAVQRHPDWLENKELWTTLPDRQENLLSALYVVADNAQDQLDWEKVLSNVADLSGTSSSGEWMRRIPLPAFEQFLAKLGDQELSLRWVNGLNARTDDVIDWMASQQRPPLALLLWICLYADYLAMCRPQLDETWGQVARNIHIYPPKQRSLLSMQALCTMVTSELFDASILLHILESVRKVVIGGNMTSRHHLYLSDHLPRMKKDRDNWDIGRRLDYWAANALSSSGMSVQQVKNAFEEPSKAKRLFKLLPNYNQRMN